MKLKGFLFPCNRRTQDECFERMLFGTVKKYWPEVKRIRKGEKGFLFNYETSTVFGIFEATSDGSLNIDPNAWEGKFPAQIKVEWVRKRGPLDSRHFGFLSGFPGVSLGRSQYEEIREAFDSFREKLPASYRADDGHFVRSEAEIRVDNWLYYNGIAHAYERRVPVEEIMYCDFYIPSDDLYIEFWGRENKYGRKRLKEKKESYKKNSLKLMSLERKDLKNLDDVLQKLLR